MSLKMNLKKVLVAVCTGLVINACDNTATNSSPLKTEIDSVSYVVGMFEGDQVRQGLDFRDSIQATKDPQSSKTDRELWLKNIEANLDGTATLTEGDSFSVATSNAEGVRLRDAIAEAPFKINNALFLRAYKTHLNQEEGSLLTPDQAKEFWGKYSAKVKAEYQAKHQAQMDSVGSINLEKGQEFLAENKTKEGITENENGIQIEILEEGTGATVTTNSEVTVHYTGTLIDETKFDSSVDRNKPFTFKFGSVIQGWDALKGMKVGTKCKLYIPADKAYGAQGQGAIAPNSVLIFEIEVLDTKEITEDNQ